MHNTAHPVLNRFNFADTHFVEGALSMEIHLDRDTPPPFPVPGQAPVLEIEQLRIGFGAGASVIDGVDLAIGRGELLCIVGESGSGKSLTSLAVMGLLPPGARVSARRMALDGTDLLAAGEAGLEHLRGNKMAMVFQEPMTSLNPVLTIGAQITEPLVRHQGLDPRQAHAAGLDMLRRVQMPAPETRFDMYPHQLSGGMRQRVMIAMALVCRPALLIADEPTTALDVTIQNQILRLIDGLRAELGTAVLFVTHNLAVVSEIADRIAVMYAGRIVEQGPRAAIFDDPQHPYTLALFAAMPRASDMGRRLASIEGQVPLPGAMPEGCRFAPRCPFAMDRCRETAPPLAEVTTAHSAACWRAPLEASVG
jgi:peptide/nickel transport system ATP-binding protein